MSNIFGSPFNLSPRELFPSSPPYLQPFNWFFDSPNPVPAVPVPVPVPVPAPAPILCKEDFTVLSVQYEKGDPAPLFSFRGNWFGRVVKVNGRRLHVYKPSESDCIRIRNRGKNVHFLVKSWLPHEFYHFCDIDTIKQSEVQIVEKYQNNTGSYKKRKHECSHADFQMYKRSKK
jgi:hypothetical protein